MDNPNQQLIYQNPNLVNKAFVQKIHYTNPMGRSNDIQSIIPHYNNGKIDYWDIYYLWDPGSTGGNQWYHVQTSDFARFTAYDKADNISINNVAIPDKDYGAFGEDHIEVDFSVNKNPLAWTFVATGSVLMNNTKSGGQSWFYVDEWGNSINHDAKLAYFSTFDWGLPVNYNATYLAYSNDNKQFHPISSTSVMDATMVGESIGNEFRDPLVIPIDNGNRLVAYEAGGWGSRIFPLTSNDGINWSHSTDDIIDINLLDDPLFKDRMIETPFVTTINNQPLIFFGVQGKEDRAISHVGWIAGRIKENGIFAFNKDSKHGYVDDGFDNYAGNFTKIDDDHLVYVGWMGNWGYFNGQHSGNFTLSRVISWNPVNGLRSQPIDSGALINQSIDEVSSQNRKSFACGKKLYFDFKSPVSNFNIIFGRTFDTRNRVAVKLENGIFSYSRTGTGNGASDLYDSIKLPGTDKISRMQVYLDNISVEVYLPEVNKTFTFLSYSGKDDWFEVNSDIPATITSYDIDVTKEPVKNEVIESVK